MPGLASDEASGLRDHYRESDLLYLLCFHSWVLGRVAVLLVDAIKVDTTRDTFDNIGTFLKVVDGTVTFHQGCLRYNGTQSLGL